MVHGSVAKRSVDALPATMESRSDCAMFTNNLPTGSENVTLSSSRFFVLATPATFQQLDFETRA